MLIDNSKIKEDLIRPKKEDFKTFDDYFQKMCEYLDIKYKETYVKE
jgi:hypothetical protein|tara:strand:- start:198 stop:335 length:138 start_codon:yes stop_codon:yes gene_type:complete